MQENDIPEKKVHRRVLQANMLYSAGGKVVNGH